MLPQGYPCAVHRRHGRSRGQKHKKLETIGAAWAGSSDQVDSKTEAEVDEDLIRFGYAARAPKAEREVEIEPENVVAVTTFFRCSTQWRSSGFGLIGLDYPALVAVMKLDRVRDKQDTFNRIRVLESAALATLSAKREADEARAKRKRK